MGGNALAATCRRHNKEEYYAKEEEILFALKGLFPHSRAYPIKAYRSKDSFGDCDVLLESFDLPSNWIEMLAEVFDSKQVIKNGNVCSFEYYELQVDIIVTKPEDFNSSAQYFDYNDLGNLIGRVAHSMGLKLGHDGLTYKFYAKERQVFREITLLKDWKDILPVLGYSYERYAQGFDTLDEMFQFVVSSPSFNKDIYLLHNRNHTSRVRDAKRKTYMSFLKYCETYEETSVQQYYKRSEDSSKHDYWIEYLFTHIPGFKEQYEEVQAEYEREQKYKERFNGNLVKEWCGIDGKELGNFMQWLKEERKDWERFKKDIITLNPVCVPRLIEYYFEKWKTQ